MTVMITGKNYFTFSFTVFNENALVISVYYPHYVVHQSARMIELISLDFLCFHLKWKIHLTISKLAELKRFVVV